MNLMVKLVFLASAMPIPDSLKNSGTIKGLLGWLTGSDVTTKKPVIEFYQAWSETLGPISNAMLTVGYGMGSFFSKMFYNIGEVLSAVYAKMFGLLGFLVKGNYAGSSQISNLHTFLVILGFSILVVAIIGWSIASMVKRPVFKEAMASVMTACAVIIILPWLVGEFNSITVHATTEMNSAVTGTKNESFEDSLKHVVISPYKDNTIDWLVMAEKNFNTNPKKIGGSKGWSDFNRIDTDNLNSINFTVNIAKDNIGYVSDKNKLNTNVFKYQLDTGVTDTHNTKVAKLDLPATQVSGITHMGQLVYPRYHVNWIAVIVELILLDGFFLLAGYKVAKYSIKIFFLMILSPLVALFRVQSMKNVKELISSIIGASTGIFVENAGVFFLITIIQVTSGTSNFIGGLAGGWQRVIATLMIYGAAIAVLIAGDQYIQRWTGTSTGQSGSMRDLVAGSMAGAGLASFAGKAGHKAVQGIEAAASAAGTVGHGIKSAGGKAKGGIDKLRSSALQDESSDGTESSDGSTDQGNGLNAAQTGDSVPSGTDESESENTADMSDSGQNQQPGNAAAERPEEQAGANDYGNLDRNQNSLGSSNTADANPTSRDTSPNAAQTMSEDGDGFDYQEGMGSLDATEPPVTNEDDLPVNNVGNPGEAAPISGNSATVPTSSGLMPSSENPDLPSMGGNDQPNDVGRATGNEDLNAASGAVSDTSSEQTPIGEDINAAAGGQSDIGAPRTTGTSGAGHLANVRPASNSTGSVRPVATIAGSAKQAPIIPAKHYSASSNVASNFKAPHSGTPDVPTTPQGDSGQAPSNGRVTNFNNIPD
ncbi:hypothetical protein CCS05_11945 (plasmid) [Levilactobacillus brevis]|uniref:pLS20_p028 family conjugation system transmembrane protein n=1 Tax=Levilactobacillus brevis TaxID=1580 RepID=UPI000D7394E5|nr:hypothetical protein [Levilactobacillus brevis]AWP47642.1 hypothetical protein CCS05_11945 [Levilactobacillus brevis]